jgi:hypothetical protein
MKVGQLEIKVSFDKLKAFQESFKVRDGVAETLVEILVAAQVNALADLRNRAASENTLRAAQGAADLVDEVIDAIVEIKKLDLDILKNQREDGEEEEEEEDAGEPIVTP